MKKPIPVDIIIFALNFITDSSMLSCSHSLKSIITTISAFHILTKVVLFFYIKANGSLRYVSFMVYISAPPNHIKRKERKERKKCKILPPRSSNNDTTS